MTARITTVAGALLFLAACTAPHPGTTPRSSGSIALSNDDALLFVADADHDRVTVIDAKTRAVVTHTQVGDDPQRIYAAPDGTLFVTGRGDRSVRRLSPSGEQVEASGEVGAEPIGMTLNTEGDRLLVANSMSGTVSVLDATTLQPVDELEVGGQPYALVAHPDGRQLYVTDFQTGTVKVVDMPARRVVETVELNQGPEAECRWGNAAPRTPAQPADIVLSHDGARAYVAHVQSRTGEGGTGQTSLALAVAPALSTVDTSNHKVFADSTEREGQDFPASMLATNLDETCRTTGGGAPGMDAPSSLVVDGAGDWIFVADHNSNAVAVLSATRIDDPAFRVPERGIYDVVRVGARPTGIAVSGDLRTAYVHNSLDYTVSVVENRQGRLSQTAAVTFASSELPADVVRGRKLFYSAVDPRLTEPELGGVSCSSCHPDGRTDHLTWVLPQDRTTTTTTTTWRQATTVRPRNTPALWGVTETAPYHWEGMVTDLPAFSRGMVSQMGGAGLRTLDLADLTAYLSTLRPPDNRFAEVLPKELLARGEVVFNQRCQSCHAGALGTDLKAHAATISGAITTTNTTTTTEAPTLDTPSLRGAFATAPYLHDGSARSLRDVVQGSRFTIKEHDLRALPTDQVTALEAYVKVR